MREIAAIGRTPEPHESLVIPPTAPQTQRHGRLDRQQRPPVRKLKAKDTIGRWAYRFVFVEPHKERTFLKTIEGDGVYGLRDFGTVLGSNYGEEPTEEVKA